MPTIRVETPRGVIEFPAGTSERDINEAVAQLMSAPVSAPPSTGLLSMARDAVVGAVTNAKDALVGAGKGVANELLGLAEMGAAFSPVGDVSPEFDRYRAAIAPSNPEQQRGSTLASIGMFALPWMPKATAGPRAARLAQRMASESVNAATHTGLQGGSPEDIERAAWIGGGAPLVTAPVGAAVQWVGSKAVPMVQSAVKATVASMKQSSGASRSGIDAVAKRMARFIIDNKLTSADKAEALIKATEADLQTLLASGGGALTDAGPRAERYLFALRKSARQQGIPADDVAILNDKIRDFMRSSPLTTTVQAVDAAGAPILDASGLPVMVQVPRQDVTVKEALDVARSTAKWSTRRQYGEQKGAAIEADKAVERAARDAAKDNPQIGAELRRKLQTESGAIQAKTALDRMSFRDANRDPLSLPAHVAIAGGKNLWAIAVQVWKNNQLKGGIYADMLGKAIQTSNAQAAIQAMRQLGAGAAVQSFIDAPTMTDSPVVESLAPKLVYYGGKQYRMVGTDEQGNAILEPWE